MSIEAIGMNTDAMLRLALTVKYTAQTSMAGQIDHEPSMLTLGP